MNILFFENSIDPNIGGVERISYVLAKYFNERGHDCFYAFCLYDYDGIDEKHKVRFDATWKADKFCSVLKKFIIKNHISVIINQDVYSKNIGLYKELKKEYDCKIINCYHLAPDFLLRRKEQGSLWKSLKVYTYNIIKGRFKWMRDMYEIADDFVLLSSTFKIDFQRIYRIPNGDKLSFIPNPLSFDRIISKDIILRKKKQVLIVSRLEEFPKNICSALRIWKQIESKVDDWNLILAGYGKDQQKILNYANKLQLRHFEFVGKTDNPQSLYAESSLFMMTSLSEGFGMTLTESLQSACIPLAFDNFSALHDILEDGVNGFIIPMEREDIYADKLISLIKNEKLRNAMAFDAMRSSCKFSIDVIGEQWMALLGANHTNC